MSNSGYQNTNYDETRPYQQDSGARVPYGAPPTKKSNTNVLLFALVGLLALALIGAGAYIFVNRGKTESGKGGSIPKTEEEYEAPDNTPVQIEQEELRAHDPEVSEVHESQSLPAPAVRSKAVADGTYYLSGAITHKQNYYIEMEVKVRDSEATGRYIVTNGENIYVTLSGSIDTDGNMRLTEYKNGKPTGYYFTGRFNESLYTGTYRSTNRKLVMDFSASTY